MIQKPISCYLLSVITMNFDGGSILFDDLGAAIPLLPMCARVVNLAIILSLVRIFLNLLAALLGLSKMSQTHALSDRQILRR